MKWGIVGALMPLNPTLGVFLSLPAGQSLESQAALAAQTEAAGDEMLEVGYPACLPFQHFNRYE